MATWDDVRRVALALPETSEDSARGNLGWSVKDKTFAWERPLRRGDIEALRPETAGPAVSRRAMNQLASGPIRRVSHLVHCEPVRDSAASTSFHSRKRNVESDVSTSPSAAKHTSTGSSPAAGSRP